MLATRGFAAADTTVLTDAAAGKRAVMDVLTSMVTSAAPGDHLVFSFSSHGTQVPDTDGDEADHADEAFATYDIAQKGNQWDPDTVIVDDELRVLLGTLPAGVLMEVFLDTCHSGTGLRAEDLLSGRRPKFLPPPTVTGLRTVDNALRRGTVNEVVKALPSASRPVLYAGCRSDQTSADATFGGRSNGAFTYYLLQALEADASRPRSAILAELTASLRSNDFGQRPTLEGPAPAKKTAVGDPW
jgi:uncharacterized caspase-like protein